MRICQMLTGNQSPSECCRKRIPPGCKSWRTRNAPQKHVLASTDRVVDGGRPCGTAEDYARMGGCQPRRPVWRLAGALYGRWLSLGLLRDKTRPPHRAHFRHFGISEVEQRVVALHAGRSPRRDRRIGRRARWPKRSAIKRQFGCSANLAAKHGLQPQPDAAVQAVQ